MRKGEENKLPKLQACVLRVNIHCDGCEKKVRKLLHKVEGVYTINIDAEQGKVTVVGSVNPATLIRKLNKAGKHAAEWPSKGVNHHSLTNQLQKLQLEHAKRQQNDSGKPQKGGADQKGQQPQQQQQGKGFKDLKFPNLKDFKFPFKKDQKSVKFDLQPDYGDEGSDYSDYSAEFDDDEDFDDLDGFDDELYDDPKMMMKHLNIQQHGNRVVNDNIDKKATSGGGNGTKGGEVQIPSKAMGGGHRENGGGGKKGGGRNNQNQAAVAAAGGGGKYGGVAHGSKNGGGSNNGKGGHGSAGKSANNDNPQSGGKKGGGKNEVMIVGGQPNKIMAQGIRGMDLGQMGNMQASMGHMGNFPAVQGLPAGGAPAGYFQGGMVPTEKMAAPNPYQQQYLQALLLQQQQQQQQQRMMMMVNGHGGAAYPQMGFGYGRPAYIPSVQSHGEPFTMFSDENPNSCSIM